MKLPSVKGDACYCLQKWIKRTNQLVVIDQPMFTTTTTKYDINKQPSKTFAFFWFQCYTRISVKHLLNLR